jgi:circadian clock protein KaiC
LSKKYQVRIVLFIEDEMYDEHKEFIIDSKGMHIGKPFRDVTSVLGGSPRHIAPAEMEQIGALFESDVGGGIV